MSDVPANGKPPDSGFVWPDLDNPALDAAKIAQRDVNRHELHLDRIDAKLGAVVRDVGLISMRIGPIESDILRGVIAQEQTAKAIDEMAVHLKALTKVVGGLRAIATRAPAEQPKRRRVKTGAPKRRK